MTIKQVSSEYIWNWLYDNQRKDNYAQLKEKQPRFSTQQLLKNINYAQYYVLFDYEEIAAILAIIKEKDITNLNQIYSFKKGCGEILLKNFILNFDCNAFYRVPTEKRQPSSVIASFNFYKKNDQNVDLNHIFSIYDNIYE